MIQWPLIEKMLGGGARRGLVFFQGTSAAKDLADDARSWHLEATSWVDELPIRLIWSDERGEQVCFVLEEPGLWHLEQYETLPVEADLNDPLTACGVPV